MAATRNKKQTSTSWFDWLFGPSENKRLEMQREETKNVLKENEAKRAEMMRKYHQGLLKVTANSERRATLNRMKEEEEAKSAKGTAFKF